MEKNLTIFDSDGCLSLGFSEGRALGKAYMLLFYKGSSVWGNGMWEAGEVWGPVKGCY